MNWNDILAMDSDTLAGYISVNSGVPFSYDDALAQFSAFLADQTFVYSIVIIPLKEKTTVAIEQIGIQKSEIYPKRLAEHTDIPMHFNLTIARLYALAIEKTE